MARVPAIRSIITTRIEQISRYSEPTIDEQQVGWTIRKKRSIFDVKKKDEQYTTSEKKEIESIIQFVMDCGESGSSFSNDTFDTFLRKEVKDSLELDQMCFEIVRNNRGQAIEFLSVDGATFRLSETFDDRDGLDKFRNQYNYKPINGYYPSYVQVWENNVVQEFYPWELCFSVRNQSSSVYNNGYGISELEDLIQIVTYILYGMQYNGNFFKQGSNPKGLLSIKGNISDSSMNEFKQAWRSTIAGVANSHKLPIIDGAMDAQWIDMHHSNKDMEFSAWNDFLMVLACSVFRIDPSELGFNFQKVANLFGQDGQKARLQHSEDKGLIPLLKFIQRKFNKFVIEQRNPEYEFVFTGIEQENKELALEMDVKKAGAGFVSLEDMFKKYSSRDLNLDSDTIINPIVQQMKIQAMMGGMGSNQAVDQQAQESGQGSSENPFMKGINEYIDRNLLNK